MENFKVTVPTSKSSFQREVMAALLSELPSKIYFDSLCNDSIVALKVASKFGNLSLSLNKEYAERIFSDIEVNRNFSAEDCEFLQENAIIADTSFAEISGKKVEINCINCGESGLLLHLAAFWAISRNTDKIISLEAEGTLSNRKQYDLIDVLDKLGGLAVTHRDYCTPIEISGKIKNNILDLGCPKGSQTLSGLLMLLSSQGGEVRVNNLKSKNYVAMTIDTLSRHGIKIKNENFEHFVVPASDPKPVEIRAEGCWSGASFWLVSGAIRGGIEIENLRPDSLQPDKAILRVLDQCGAKIKYENGSFKCEKNESPLKAFSFDATQCPDLIPNLTVLALFCRGVSRITGVRRLHNKESDRAAALLNEISKIGGKISLDGDDVFTIIGGEPLHFARCESYNDHRIIMAMYLAGLIAANPVQINETKSVGKSYPEFISDVYAYNDGNNR